MKIQSINLNTGNCFFPSAKKYKECQNQTSENLNSLPNIYFFPISFSKKRTYSSDIPELQIKTTNFMPNKFDGLTCPACGKKMLTKSKFNAIKNDLNKIKPDEYLEYLKQYKEYMRPVEESVFDELYSLSIKEDEPNDVRNLLIELRKSKLPKLQETQLNLVSKMNKLASHLPENEKETMYDYTLNLAREICRTDANSPFRRKIMIDNISKIPISNPRKYNKLQKIAQKFPTSKDMNSAWIVKYSGLDKNGNPWDSKTIAQRLLFSSVASTDHMLAHGIEENHDDITNYIGMHNGCNENKCDKKFLQWLYEDKQNRINYIKQYFSEVQELIDEKKIKEPIYENYVAYATQTVNKLSKGRAGL